MTQKEKLQAVTEDIRVKLPRLMELEKGCLLENDNDFIEICKKLPKTSKYNDNFYQGFSYDDNCGHWFYENQIEDLDYKIIGKEPMLNDVLEWISLMHIEEIIFKLEKHCFFIKDDVIPINDWYEWNLSTPYLKDQSEELINFLYELL